MAGGRVLRGRLAAVLATLALALFAAPATADHQNVSVPNWPEFFPANPDNSASMVPLGWDVCPSGDAGCPAGVVAEMTRRWRPLDARCDHNAVFAQLYFDAIDGWRAHRRVPAAWRIAFRAARSPNVTATGDLLLGMNAHIQRDLSYTLAHVGLVKPDHDRVNSFLDRVADPLQVELAERYDPMFAMSDASPSPIDEVGVLQAVRGMREAAWRNAERLVNARSAAERRLVSASIERYTAANARAILASNTVPEYGPVRDAHCAAN